MGEQNDNVVGTGTDSPAWAEEIAPRLTAHLFRPILGELIRLLRGLDAADWDRGTVAGAWKIKDVAMHLLDGDLRKIAAYRDGHVAPTDVPIQSNTDLARFVNNLNAGGVSFGVRLSPRLLTDLLEISGTWTADLIDALPPDAPSLFAVSWAGEAESTNWMDTGREYTERWHHQMQIRDALGEPRLLDPSWMDPLIEFSVRALPVAYAGLEAPPGTTVALEVHGQTAGRWSVMRRETDWRVFRGRPESPHALVRLAADDFWRVFYNATSEGLTERIEVDGNIGLAQPMLKARSVIL